MNVIRDVIDAHPGPDRALIEITAAGARREHTYADLAAAAGRTQRSLAAAGARRGAVVLLLAGAGSTWVHTYLACLRGGYVLLACPEQLRPADLAARATLAGPAVAVVADRHRATAEAAGLACPVLLGSELATGFGPVPPAAELAAEEPCLLTFTSGTSGAAKAAVHAQRYLPGQRRQVRHWLGVRRDDVVWCTAAPGWSKSARNGVIAAWLAGATAVVHDARFDAEQRWEVTRQERVSVWCMAPTEYRMMASRIRLEPVAGLRSLVAAGEALDPVTLATWREATGVEIRDGYGQTETGQLTANPPGVPTRPGSMGRALPGVVLEVRDGELAVDPASVPTFFLGYLAPDAQPGAPVPGRLDPPAAGWWHTGDRVHQDPDGYLFFAGRLDDLIISAGYRIGPTDVEDVLRSHPAVDDVAVVAAPDAERGHVVRAVVVLRAGEEPSDELRSALQRHAQQHSAPYKYPRIVDFVTELPRTATGKVRRAALRHDTAPPPPGGETD